jgi:CheY-like chemotaxis protein
MTATAMPSNANERPRVLLAEDNPVNALVIAKQLGMLGYLCIVAEDGERAWTALQDCAFVALLTDCEMPVLDGYALAKRVRATPAFAGLPIIALSARPDGAQRVRCLAAGMDACLSKPISNRALADALELRADAQTGTATALRGLDALQAMFPNPQSLITILTQFVQTTRTDLVELERLHFKGAQPAFGRMLHRIAGSLQLLDQADLAAELHGWQRSGTLPSATDYARMHADIAAVVDRMQAWMWRLSSR